MKKQEACNNPAIVHLKLGYLDSKHKSVTISERQPSGFRNLEIGLCYCLGTIDRGKLYTTHNGILGLPSHGT